MLYTPRTHDLELWALPLVQIRPGYNSGIMKMPGSAQLDARFSSVSEAGSQGKMEVEVNTLNDGRGAGAGSRDLGCSPRLC